MILNRYLMKRMLDCHYILITLALIHRNFCSEEKLPGGQAVRPEGGADWLRAVECFGGVGLVGGPPPPPDFVPLIKRRDTGGTGMSPLCLCFHGSGKKSLGAWIRWRYRVHTYTTLYCSNKLMKPLLLLHLLFMSLNMTLRKTPVGGSNMLVTCTSGCCTLTPVAVIKVIWWFPWWLIAQYAEWAGENFTLCSTTFEDLCNVQGIKV